MNEYADFREIIRDIIKEEIEKFFKKNSVEKKYGGIITSVFFSVAKLTIDEIEGVSSNPSAPLDYGTTFQLADSGNLKVRPDIQTSEPPTIAVVVNDYVQWTAEGWTKVTEIPVDPYLQKCSVDLGFTTIGSTSPDDMILNKTGEVLNIGDSVSVYANPSGSFVNAYVGVKHTPLN